MNHTNQFNTEQTISVLQELLDKKIADMQNQFAETVKLIRSFDNSSAVSSSVVSSTPINTGKIVNKNEPVKVKAVKAKPSEDGKVKFSKYLLGLFEENPDKDYDLQELGDNLNMAIKSGRAFAAAGKVKDEVSKRLYQFLKRKDIVRTNNGTYQFNPGRGTDPEINKN